MNKNTLMGIIGILLLGLGLAIGYIQGKNNLISILPVSLGAIAVVLWLFLDIKNIFSFLGSKGFRYGTNSAVMTVIFLAILVFLQLIVVNKKVQFDVTQDKSFTLSEQTSKILENLKQKIELVAFTDKRNNQAKDLLEQYKTITSNISYEIVDPNINPGRAKQYQITQMNTVVLINGLKQEKITEINEDKLTNALIKVTREGQKTIYFIEGHGEKRISDSEAKGISFFKEELEKQNYLVKNLLLVQSPEIPADASVIVIPGLEKPLLAEEERLLENYIKKGGRVIALTDPDVIPYSRNFFNKFNITVRNDIIVDKLSRAFGGDFLVPMVPSYGSHSSTKNLRAMSFFPLASSLDISASGKEGITVEALASTTENSWGETNKELLKKNTAGFDNGDIQGPLTIAALATIPVKASDNKDANSDKKAKSGQIMVFGDSDFITNSSLRVQGNGDFILNITNWMAEEDDLIAIRPKDRKNTPVMLTETQGRMLFWSNLIFLPLTIIILGTVVTTRRRLRAA